MNEINQEIILSHIQEELSQSDESISATTQLISTGALDSISVLQLVDFLEQRFEIEFEAHEVDADNLNTVERIVAFIKEKKSAQK